MMYVVANKTGASKLYFGLYFAYIYTHAQMLGQIMSQYARTPALAMAGAQASPKRNILASPLHV